MGDESQDGKLEGLPLESLSNELEEEGYENDDHEGDGETSNSDNRHEGEDHTSLEESRNVSPRGASLDNSWDWDSEALLSGSCPSRQEHCDFV